MLAFLLAGSAIFQLDIGSCWAFQTANPMVSVRPRPSSPTTRPYPIGPPSTTAFRPLCTTSTENPPPSPPQHDRIDWTTAVKYPVGLAGQWSLLFGLFHTIDTVRSRYYPSLHPPFLLNVAFLYFFNLKASVFSLLPNSKDERLKLEVTPELREKRKVPKWTPPGVAFVLGWPLLTFGLRAVTGAMVVTASGGVWATPAIGSLMLHLAVGDLWNTANNVEDRLGVSVVLIYALWLTKAFAAYQFYRVQPLAGKLLAVTLTWISAAVALLTQTWRLNPDPVTGRLDALTPLRRPGRTTKFRWER